MANIAILGCGFGTALAIMADHAGHQVTAWSAFAEEIEAIRRDKEHKKLLPGVPVPESIHFTTNLEDISSADVVLFVIPTAFLRQVAKKAAPFLSPKAIVVNGGKGLEMNSLKRMSQVLEEELPGYPIVVLSGPCHAEEIARGMPSAVAAASKDMESAFYIQEIFSNSTLRVYLNDDVVGCELGGALKNIIALCAGICDGMGYGDNTKAALMTRGITEIARLGVALGGKSDTFAGLTGIGDLIVTCTSMHSRNRRAGILIGQGVSPQEAVAQVGTVEGYACTKAAWDLCQEKGVTMPIISELHSVLWGGKPVGQALADLMARPRRHESETVWTGPTEGNQLENSI